MQVEEKLIGVPCERRIMSLTCHTCGETTGRGPKALRTHIDQQHLAAKPPAEPKPEPAK